MAILLPRLLFYGLILFAIVLVELAVLLPVIITQRQKDESLVGVQLQTLTDDLATRMNRTVATFMYNVVRAAAAAPTHGFMSQTALEDAVQLQEDPRITPELLYFWVPLVHRDERDAYTAFYGFNITQLSNGTSVAPVPRNTNRTAFAPFTIFVPPLPPTTNPAVYGFDLLSRPSTASVFKNITKYLLIPGTLLPTTLNQSVNSYGFIAVAQNKYGKGWMFGRIGSKELLEFSLTVPRQYVTMAAYVTSTNSSQQALFYDISPLLPNATNVSVFNSLPARSQFYTSSFTAVGETILVAVRYDPQYANQFVANTWVILAAVLAPVCFLIDVIFVVLVLLWERQKQLHVYEQGKRKEAQVMIGYVNHEIRNPLQTILGLAELRLEEAEEENAPLASDLATIIRAAEFIEHIATDILDLRRVEEGKLPLEISDVDLRLLVSGLEKAVAPYLREKPDVEFRVVIDPELHTIRTDRYRLEQILMNFLSNAFKHTTKGFITLLLTFIDGMLRFAVADTGDGIPPDMKEKLFQEFSQASTKDASEFGGFGLGLYLTKRLAKLLGGHVGFESEVGVGSTFSVELPLRDNGGILALQFDEGAVQIPHMPK